MSEAGAPVVGKIDFTIQNIPFEAAAPYAEGQVLNAAEAATLNQTRVENLRNNFAGVIKKKIAEIEKETPSRTELSEEEIQSLKDQFATYEAEYEFQGKRASRAPVDPVKREAVRMAKETITAALKAKDMEPKQLADGVMEKLIAGYLEKNPAVMEEAQARVAAARNAASDALEGMEIDLKPAAAPQAAPAA